MHQQHCTIRAMLDAHRLRVFRAVVAAGSINGAAASLGYTPSAVSQHVTALQRETGLALVERHGRGIVPTPAGRLFAEESRHALERLAALESVAADLRAGRLGRLTLSYFASAGAVWVPPVAATLTREFPGLRLDLRLTERAVESPFVPDVELFVQGAASTSLDAYDVRPLLDEPYLAVLPARHPLAGKTAVQLADLRDEAWIDNDVTHGPCRQIVLDACASKGFTPSFQVEAQDYASAIAFVAAAGGLTVVPRVATRSLPDGLAAVPIVDPVPRRSILLRVRRTVADNDAVRRTAELLQKSVPA
jgi:DNA-binding transcriptional LysR family regulator